MEALQANPNFKMRVDAFTGKASDHVKIIPNYYKRRFHEKLNSLTSRSSIELSYVEKQYLSDQVDIVHLQQSYLHKKLEGLLSLPKFERPKIVITLRGADTYVKPWLDISWREFYSSYGQKVDAFIVMSAHQKQYLHAHWGVLLDKIHVIPISFGNKQTYKPKTLSSHIVKVASAFRMCWEKNIEGNLRVIKLLKDQNITVQYDLYGDGPDAGQVYYLIDKYGLGDCVNYHGRVTNIDLKTRLASSDFFLQLSHSESLGMTVIEAQTLGLPAIVSNSGGLSETIIPNESGYVVEAHDADAAVDHIMNLFSDSLRYNQFSGKAIEHAETNFAVDKEVERLMLLYNSLL